MPEAHLARSEAQPASQASGFRLGLRHGWMAQRGGWTDGRTDKQTNGWTDGQMDGQMDRQMDGHTDGYTNGWTDPLIEMR